MCVVIGNNKSTVSMTIAVLLIAIVHTESARAGQVELRAAEKIRVADPLLIQVLFANSSDKPLEVHPQLSSAFGTVQFELKRPGRDEFEEVSTAMQGLRGANASSP